GGCFKLPFIHSERVWIIGDLKQPPRLRQLRNGAVFFMAQPPLLREGGECAYPSCPQFGQLCFSGGRKEKPWTRRFVLICVLMWSLFPDSRWNEFKPKVCVRVWSEFPRLFRSIKRSWRGCR